MAQSPLPCTSEVKQHLTHKEKESEMGSDPLLRERVENTFGLQRWPQAASY